MFFPTLNGLNLPFEVETFFAEHYLACLGPSVLMLCGRYGEVFEGLGTLLKHQLFGFGTHILYMKLINIPVSHFTWANINFMLCHS